MVVWKVDKMVEKKVASSGLLKVGRMDRQMVDS